MTKNPISADGASESAPPADEPRIAPGSLVCENFRVIRPLEQDAWSAQWLAEDTRTLDKCVLTEVTHPPAARPELVDGWNELGDQLQHPNLVRVLQRRSNPCVSVSTYVNGESLQATLADGVPLRPKNALRLLLQVGSALDCVHAANLVHHGVTPSGIMITSTPRGPKLRVKLMDFGPLPTVDEAPNSSWRCRAPECFEGDASQSASDIYALAAVAWWALTGREFLSEFDNLEDVARVVKSGKTHRNISVLSEVPRRVAFLLSAMLSPQVQTRPSAAEVVDEVRRAWRDWENEVESGGLARANPRLGVSTHSHRLAIGDNKRPSTEELARVATFTNNETVTNNQLVSRESAEHAILTIPTMIGRVRRSLHLETDSEEVEQALEVIEDIATTLGEDTMKKRAHVMLMLQRASMKTELKKLLPDLERDFLQLYQRLVDKVEKT